ncbi:MAG: hypothetical protein IPH85_09570 [Ignavibacteria bacterium]|nr:hypothetical protein [Ignavibacteria bacterium]
MITRRSSRALEEGTDLPDLVIIDGGKGQLSHAMEIFASLGLIGRFTVVGLAKRLEEVFVPGQSVPLYLAKTSASLRLRLCNKHAMKPTICDHVSTEL